MGRRTLRFGAMLALTALYVVLISVALHAEPPVAISDAVSTLEEMPVTFDVLDNDFDPDNDLIRFVRHSEPIYGNVECTAGVCTYTPPLNFVGDDAFTYTISTVDGTAGVDENHCA